MKTPPEAVMFLSMTVQFFALMFSKSSNLNPFLGNMEEAPKENTNDVQRKVRNSFLSCFTYFSPLTSCCSKARQVLTRS